MRFVQKCLVFAEADSDDENASHTVRLWCFRMDYDENAVEWHENFEVYQFCVVFAFLSSYLKQKNFAK